ncbi:hypothetical protein PLEOSDRAFT_1073778 [Pleurotus ostreatus PC15]|uniref:NADPH:adrenodoxin oxidoreductase, mitochondrial n=1 Tax=Pleurotus ostreatus (strain PC15) TaxID=1137138 RepID=A0A067P075_PLEO1|nr:hypothetical protein PLEOSDRAFT_1073778 [Pleurotus ostreatus PC15]
MKLAIVGAGPSAFYAASRILSGLPDAQRLRVHLFDRLWAPHGLVRYGVAPDHPEVKNCTHKFDGAAQDPRLRFFGNVNVGGTSTIPHNVNVPLASLCANYSHLLFATGCTVPSMHSALPTSEYCRPALSLVHWYTQHPSHQPPPPLDKITHVSLIGNGNVSLDVARMLLTPVSILKQYDVPETVLEVLSRSTVRHVSIIARRGPLEAAFTTKELRELINLPNASMTPIDKSILDTSDVKLTRQQSRIFQLLEKGSKQPFGSTEKTWSLDFFRSPTGLMPTSNPSFAQLSLAHTVVDPITKKAELTGETSLVETSLVVPSLGFQGEPNMPFYDPALRHLRTVAGRLVSSNGNVVRNAYASGWASTGAKGVLASTMIDAYAVADTILLDSSSPEADIQNASKDELSLNQSPDLEGIPSEVEQGLRENSIVGYDDWRRIDQEEIARGEALGKERERMGWEEARRYIYPS